MHLNVLKLVICIYCFYYYVFLSCFFTISRPLTFGINIPTAGQLKIFTLWVLDTLYQLPSFSEGLELFLFSQNIIQNISVLIGSINVFWSLLIVICWTSTCCLGFTCGSSLQWYVYLIRNYLNLHRLQDMLVSITFWFWVDLLDGPFANYLG